MDAWADGLNYFLATHPKVHPRVLKRFEPWMVLSFTEGSIGGDIERIDLDGLRDFYSNRHLTCCRDQPVTGTQSPKWMLNELSMTMGGCRTPGLERHRHRAQAHQRRPRAAADQPAHQLLLPLRAADDERRGARTPTARRPGASSSSTRASTRTPAGCTRRAASIVVDEFAEKVERRGKGHCYRYGSACRPSAPARSPSAIAPPTDSSARAASPPGCTHHGPIVAREERRAGSPSR